MQVSSETHPDQFKIHETPEDRIRQKQILKEFAHSRSFTGKLTTTLDRMDATLFKEGNYCAVAEAKYRNNTIDKYGDYTIDVDKVDHLIERAKTDGVKAYLVVSWEGDTRFLNLTKVADQKDDDDYLFPISMQKRNDRKEVADRVYHISTTLFRKVQTT